MEGDTLRVVEEATAATGVDATITPQHHQWQQLQWQAFHLHRHRDRAKIYCYSCGYDVPLWHTSITCNYCNHHHQEGCTRANMAAYKAAGHAVSDRNQFRTIMPTQPMAEQA